MYHYYRSVLCLIVSSDQAYHNHVIRDAWFRANGPKTNPMIGHGRHTKHSHISRLNSPKVHNVIFHDRSETRAFENSTPESLQQHGAEVDSVDFILDTINQEAHQTLGCGMQLVALFNGDVIDHVPWELLIVNRSIFIALFLDIP